MTVVMSVSALVPRVQGSAWSARPAQSRSDVATFGVDVCGATTCSCSPLDVSGCRRRHIVPPCSVASRCFTPFRPFGRLWRPGPDLRAAADSHLSSAARRSRRTTSRKHPEATCVGAHRLVRCRTLLRVAHKIRRRQRWKSKCARKFLTAVFAPFDRPKIVHLTARSRHERTRDRRDGDTVSRSAPDRPRPLDHVKKQPTRAVRRQAAVSEIRAGRLQAARVGGRRELRLRAEWIDAWLSAQTTVR